MHLLNKIISTKTINIGAPQGHVMDEARLNTLREVVATKKTEIPAGT